MFEKLGKRSLAAPLGIAIILCLFLSLVLAPIMRMSPHDVPFVFVNLDEGASIATEDLDIGELLTEALLDEDGDADEEDADADASELEELVSEAADEEDADEEDSSLSAFGSVSTDVTIAWTQMDSEEEAIEALNGLDYYGAFVIPEDFTAQYLNYLVGVGEAPEVTVYLNAGKNAAMASTMSSALMNAMLQADVAVDVQTLNSADVGGGTMSSAVVVQLMVVPLMVMSLVPSILTALVFWLADVTKLRRKHPIAAAIVMVLLIVVFSAVNAGLDLCIESFAGGMDLPIEDIYPFLWACSFCMMLACTGLCALCLPLGALVGILTIGLGMSTALFGPEMLPDFWANWIYPWAPQAYMGNSLRMLIFFGEDPFCLGTTHLEVMAAIGVVALLLACLVALVQKHRGKKDAPAEAEAEAPAADAESEAEAPAADAEEVQSAEEVLEEKTP